MKALSGNTWRACSLAEITRALPGVGPSLKRLHRSRTPVRLSARVEPTQPALGLCGWARAILGV